MALCSSAQWEGFSSGTGIPQVFTGAIFSLVGEKLRSEFLGIHVSAAAFYFSSARAHGYNPYKLENSGGESFGPRGGNYVSVSSPQAVEPGVWRGLMTCSVCTLPRLQHTYQQ